MPQESRKKLYQALSNQFDLGSYEEFDSKMNNPESRKKLYNAVSQEFDLGSIEDFESKIGGQESTQTQKKNETSTSGSKQPAKTTSQPVQKDVAQQPIVQQQPDFGPPISKDQEALLQGMGTQLGEFQPSVTPKEQKIPLAEKQPVEKLQTTFQEDKGIVKGLHLERKRSLDADFLMQTEEQVAVQFNNKFDPYGFKAEEIIPGLDMVRITAPNGNSIKVHTDNFTKDKASKESKRLQAFIDKNMPGKYVQRDAEKEIRFDTDKDVAKKEAELKERLRKADVQSRKFELAASGIKERVATDIVEIQERYSKGEITFQQAEAEANKVTKKYAETNEVIGKQYEEFLSQMSALQGDSEEIDKAIDRYMDMKGGQENWMQENRRAFTKGLDGVIAGVLRTPEFVLDIAVEGYNKLAEGIELMTGIDQSRAPTTQEMGKMLGINNRMAQLLEQRKKELDNVFSKYDGSIIDFIEAGEYGKAARATSMAISESLPFTLGIMGATFSGAGIFSQFAGTTAVMGANRKQELLETSDAGEATKNANSLMYGIGEAFEVLLGAGGFARSLKRVIEKEGLATAKKWSAQFMLQVLRDNPWLAPFKEGLQELMTTIVQNAADVVYLGEDKSITEGGADAVIVGTVMGSGFTAGQLAAQGIVNQQGKKERMNVMRQVSFLASDGNALQSTFDNINKDIAELKITEKEGNRRQRIITENVSAYNSMPDNFTERQKADALGLLVEKKQIEGAIEGKDESLIKPEKERLEEIDQELDKISRKGKDYGKEDKKEGDAAVSEQLGEQQPTDADVESEVSEQTEVGEESQEVTASEKEILDIESTAAALEELLQDVDNKLKIPLTSTYNRGDSKEVSKAYHKAKKDGSNPELVEAVESLLSEQADVSKMEITPELVSQMAAKAEEIESGVGTEEEVTEATTEEVAETPELKDVESTAKALEKSDKSIVFEDTEYGSRMVGGTIAVREILENDNKRENIPNPSSIPWLPKILKLFHVTKNANKIIKEGSFSKRERNIDTPIDGVYFTDDSRWSDTKENEDSRFGTGKEKLSVSVENEGLIYFDNLSDFEKFLKENGLPSDGRSIEKEQLKPLIERGIKGILLKTDFASQTGNELIVIDESIIKDIEKADGSDSYTELPKSYFNAKHSVLSEAYHKAKKDGSNPELVKAVESLLSEQQEVEQQTKEQQDEKAEQVTPKQEVLAGASETGDKDKGRKESEQLRKKEEVKPKAKKSAVEKMAEKIEAEKKPKPETKPKKLTKKEFNEKVKIKTEGKRKVAILDGVVYGQSRVLGTINMQKAYSNYSKQFLTPAQIKERAGRLQRNMQKKLSKIDVGTPGNWLLVYFAGGGKVSKAEVIARTGYAAADLVGTGVAEKGVSYHDLWNDVETETGVPHSDDGDALIDEYAQMSKSSLWELVNEQLKYQEGAQQEIPVSPIEILEERGYAAVEAIFGKEVAEELLAEDNEFQLSLLSDAQRAELDAQIAETMNADGSSNIDKYIKDNTNEKAERVDKTTEDGGVQQVERGGEELSQDVTPESDAKEQVGGPLESVESTAKALYDKAMNKLSESAKQLSESILDRFKITRKGKEWVVKGAKSSTIFDVSVQNLIAEYIENNEMLDRAQKTMDSNERYWRENIVPKYGDTEYNKMSREAYQASQMKARDKKTLDNALLFNEYLTQQIAEAYHKAKADGSNPELVKAVESLLSKESAPKTSDTRKAELGTRLEAAKVKAKEAKSKLDKAQKSLDKDVKAKQGDMFQAKQKSLIDDLGEKTKKVAELKKDYDAAQKEVVSLQEQFDSLLEGQTEMELEKEGKETVSEGNVPKSEDGLYQIYVGEYVQADGTKRKLYTVPSIQNKESRGRGDAIFDNIEDAISKVAENRTEEKILEAKKKAEDAAAKKEAEIAEAKKKEKEGLTAAEIMQKGKEAAVLNKKIIYNGKITTTREFLEQAQKEGRYVVEHNVKKYDDKLGKFVETGRIDYRLFEKGGTIFNSINKTEAKYFNAIKEGAEQELSGSQKAKAELDAAKKAFDSKMRGDLQFGGLGALPEFVKLVKAYAKLGIANAADFIAKFKADFQNVTIDTRNISRAYNEVSKQMEREKTLRENLNATKKERTQLRNRAKAAEASKAKMADKLAEMRKLREDVAKYIDNNLPKGDIISASLVKQIARANTPTQIDKILNRIDELVLENIDKEYAKERNNLIERVKKLMSKETYQRKLQKGQKIAKSKVDALAMQQAQSVIDNITTPIDQMSNTELLDLADMLEGIVVDGKIRQREAEAIRKTENKAKSLRLAQAIAEKKKLFKPVTNIGEAVEQLGIGNVVLYNGQLYDKTMKEQLLLDMSAQVPVVDIDGEGYTVRDLGNGRFSVKKLNANGKVVSVPNSDPRRAEAIQEFRDQMDAAFMAEVSAQSIPIPTQTQGESKRIKGVWAKTVALYDLLYDFAKGKGSLAQLEKDIYDPATKATKAAESAMFRGQKRHKDERKRIFKGDGRARSRLYAKAKVNITNLDGKKVELTNDNIVYLFNVLQRSEMVDKFYDAKFSDQAVEDIFNYMLLPENADLKAFAESIRQQYADYLPEINDALTRNGNAPVTPKKVPSREVLEAKKGKQYADRYYDRLARANNGVVPMFEPYSPASVAGREVGNMQDMDLLGGNADALSVISNNVQETTSGGALQLKSAEQMFQDWIGGMTNMVEKLDLFGSYKSIFNQANMNLISETYGKQYASKVREMANSIIIGKSANSVNSGISRWLNRSTAVTMFANIPSAIFQQTSKYNYAFEDKIFFDYVANLGKSYWNKDYRKSRRKIWQSDWLQARIKGDLSSVELKELSESESKFNELLDRVLSQGYTPTKLMDANAIVSGGTPYYMALRDRYYRENKATMSNADAMKQAEEKAMDKLYQRSQQSQQSSSQVEMSSEQKNPGLRILLTFGSVGLQYTRLSIRAARDLKNGRGNPLENVAKIVYFMGVQNMAFNFLSKALSGILTGDDEDEQKYASAFAKTANAAFDNAVRGLGVYGAISVVLKNAMYDIVAYSAMSDVRRQNAENKKDMTAYKKKLRKQGRSEKYISRFQTPEAEGFAAELIELMTEYGASESDLKRLNPTELTFNAIRTFVPNIGAKISELRKSASEGGKGNLLSSAAMGAELVTNIPVKRIVTLYEQGADALNEDYDILTRIGRLTNIIKRYDLDQRAKREEKAEAEMIKALKKMKR